MAFTPISENEIATGEPVSSSTATLVKENLDNLNSRVTTLEGGGSTVYPPIVLRVNGSYGESGDLAIPATGLLKTTLNFNLTVTGVRLIVDQAGISGTTEIDLEYKRGAGSWTSVFSTKPSLSYTAGNDSTSTNAVLDAGEVNLLAGDLVRLSITSAQARSIGLMARIDYIKS